jgi:hypothetical protein
MKENNTSRWALPVISLAALLWIVGCTKSTAPTVVEDIASEDAAMTIASALGEEDGGALDQMGDATDLASQAGSLMEAAKGTEIAYTLGVQDSVSKIFNTTDTSWTVFVKRVRTSMLGMNTAAFFRLYQIQFRNRNGIAQQAYVVNGDTAYSMNFKILAGSGVRKVALRRTHRLASLSGSWVITGTNTRVTTVNGNSSSAGSDTLRTREAERTLNYTLSQRLSIAKHREVPVQQSATAPLEQSQAFTTQSRALPRVTCIKKKPSIASSLWHLAAGRVTFKWVDEYSSFA